MTAFSFTADATVFTATTSGNFSSSATWAGGVAPGNNITSDQIVIDAGVDVNLDQNLTINGVTGSLTVMGSLTSNNSSDLTISSGTLTGSGDVTVDALTLGTAATFTSTGTVTANTFTTSMASLSLTTDLNVNGDLQINAGSLALGAASTLGLANNATVTLNNGGGISGTGTLSAAGSYNVVYTGSAVVTSGLELTGSAVNDITINLGSTATLFTLTSDLTANGTLNIQTGTLVLAGNDLMVTGMVTTGASGAIASAGTSNITINGTGNLSFTSLGNTVGNLTVNASAGSVSIDSDVIVSGALTLTSGTLDVSDVALTLSGTVSAVGTGSIAANGSTDINVMSNLMGELNFANSSGGSGNAGLVGDLTIMAGAANSITLGTDLEVSGTLALTSGTLVLNDNELTISGNLSASGTGNLMGSANSSLIVETAGSLNGDITFAATGQMLQELAIDLGAGGTASLGSDLTVDGEIDLAGELNLNGNTLTVGSGTTVMVSDGGSITGSGTFNGTASYDLMISGSGNVDLGIETTGSGLNDLDIDLGTGNTATLNGDLVVNGTLSLNGGTLILNNNDLTINGDIAGSGTANGSITTTAGSNITISSATSTTGSLNFAGSGNAVSDLTIDVQDGGSVALDGELDVNGTLNFISGSVEIMDSDLIISGTVSGADSTSYVITSGLGGLAMDVTTGTTAMFYVGTATNGFSPAMIDLNAGGAANGNFTVRVDEGVLSGGTTGGNAAQFQSLVDATWFVESDITGTMDMDLEVMWNASMEANSFNNAEAYISHYTAGSWDSYTSAAATAEGNGYFSLRREGVTSLSPFAVFDDNTNVGITELATEYINVYPNPAVSTITVEGLEGFADNARVSIVNLAGQEVYISNSGVATGTLNISNLENGMYIIRIEDDAKTGNFRFVKN